MHTYKTKLEKKDIDITYPCVYLESADIEIQYDIEIEHKTWGIKGISISIVRVLGTIEMEKEDESVELLLQDPEIVERVIDTNEGDWEMKAEWSLESSEKEYIVPSFLEIDLENNKIECQF